MALWALVLAVRLAREQARPPPPPARAGPLRPDVNRAPAPLLQLLPRIGPVRARAIVEERRAGGPFADLAGLERVRGIGPHTVGRLADQAAVGPPASGPRPAAAPPAGTPRDPPRPAPAAASD